MARILIIDDEQDALVILSKILSMAGHESFPLDRGDEVVAKIEELGAELVISDIMMPGVTGGDVYAEIRKEFGPEFPVILSTATRLHVRFDDDRMLASCPKPVNFAALLDTTARLLAQAGNAEPVQEPKQD